MGAKERWTTPGPSVELAHLTALDLDPVRFASLAAQAGFDSVSLRLAPVAPGAQHYALPARSAALKEARTAIVDLGVTVTGIEIVSLSPDLDVASVEPLLETGAELGASGLCVTGDDRESTRIADTFGRLCALAAGYGINVDLEFMRWRPVAELGDAASVVTAAGAANGFVLLDVLHLCRSGGTAADIAATDSRLFRAVQISDAHAEIPSHLDVISEARGGRLPVGDGALPLSAIVAALPPHVIYSAELPTTSAPADVLVRSRRAIADLLLANLR